VNRADRLYSVLRDGRPHSRQEVFDRVGFMLTNNAASELRARGVPVEHRKDGGLDVYRLASPQLSLDMRGAVGSGPARKAAA